jgi:hypothetical protein
MSGYAGWKRERRRERVRWAAFKADTPLYGAIRLAERGGFWYARRRNLKYVSA